MWSAAVAAFSMTCRNCLRSTVSFTVVIRCPTSDRATVRGRGTRVGVDTGKLYAVGPTKNTVARWFEERSDFHDPLERARSRSPRCRYAHRSVSTPRYRRISEHGCRKRPYLPAERGSLHGAAPVGAAVGR